MFLCTNVKNITSVIIRRNKFPEYIFQSILFVSSLSRVSSMIVSSLILGSHCKKLSGFEPSFGDWSMVWQQLQNVKS